MGELFDRHVPAEHLEWTGERLVGSVRGQVEAEHIHRYFVARTLCRGLDVLDIASGEGYGSALIAQTARSVVGVELDPIAVAHAQTSYVSAGLVYRQGDARAIPLDDASVDCVVSFETIEHFYDHASFMSEIRRVLRPDGFLLISSPDRDIYSPSGGHVNEHHLNELTRAEFEATLKRQFSQTVLLAQRPIVGSVLVGEPLRATGPMTFERRVGQRFEASDGIARPLYWVAVASNAVLPAIPDSFFFEDTGLDAVAEIPLLRARADAAQHEAHEARVARDHLSAKLDFEVGELTRLRREREIERRTSIAQAGELGAMRDRLLGAQGHSDMLQSKLDESDQARLLAQASILTLSDDLAKSKAEAAQLAARMARLTAGSDMSHKGTLFAELAGLRARIERFERESGAAEMAELRRVQTAVLGSLRRPAPIELPPEALSGADLADYQTLSQSLLLDVEWYRARYSDVADSGIDPVLHYMRYGWREGRRPSPGFDGDAYLSANPDVAKAGINPLVHYHAYGALEDRPLSADRYAIAATLPGAGRPPRYWFFAGDTIEWIDHHAHLTGVGHVTSELLFAALADTTVETIIPCIRGHNVSGLVRLESAVPILRLAALSGRAVTTDPLARSLADYARHPAPGDHVFFTGVVWTDSYAVLFRHLAECGIQFSVLIHDIIPIVAPDLVTEDYARGFTDWLAVTLQTASAIHVSTEIVKHQILRWAASARIAPSARIEPIAFGVRCLPRSNARDAEVLTRVAARFVLCVGTIDTRKNQAMLLHVWQTLASEIDAERMPQLVLAGRDDLRVATDPAFHALFDSGKALLLEELGDSEVAALYRACLFTVFPSISEGYGMPVAESLGYGKLCLSAALPEIQAHAGDFAWYFEPGDAEAMRGVVRQAILAPDGPITANARIAGDFDPPRWQNAVSTMLATARTALADPLPPPLSEPERFAGTVTLQPGETLRQASVWCTDTDPEVSILIVNWNAAALTLDCIRQIWAKTVGVRYQIVIADNGSMESDLQRLRGLGDGITLIEIGCNRYFGEANNIAAERASGRYICLLNNDAFVEAGWLDALLAPLHEQADIGATGPMFLFADGRVQEAGAIVDEGGYPIRFGRDAAEITADLLVPKVVDYISAAALLVDRALYMEVGGFDLGYEPAYYEDTDLCLKLRAFGRKVLYCPAARVIHIEGSSANGDKAAEEARQYMGDLNRGKFVARWGGFLRSRDERDLVPIRERLPLSAASVPAPLGADAPSAIVFTPFPLTPGGGERYLLSVAAMLATTHRVTLVTSHPYSRLRLQSLGAEFGLELDQLLLSTDPTLETIGAPDIQVVMDNHIIPCVPARGRHNVYHCQFPFPLGRLPSAADRAQLAGYDSIVVNSHFTAIHIEAALNGMQLPNIDVTVVSPPVPQFVAGQKQPYRILSVGRFFRGGHSKRHDLLIDAFRLLVARLDGPVEFHIAGSSTPHGSDIRYLAELMASAEDLPVHFHVNVAKHDLERLYAGANAYWHGTGLGTDLTAQPWAAEHFGISVVEAMSAGAIPFALSSGGPREIIHHGVDGFLYDTPETLVAQTLAFLSGTPSEQDAIRAAAHRRAADFSPEAFYAALRTVFKPAERPQPVSAVAPPVAVLARRSDTPVPAV